MQSLVLPEAGDIRCDDVEVPHEVPILAERGAVVVPEDPFHRSGEPLYMALGEARSLLEFLRESGDGRSELTEVLLGAGLAHRPANEGGAMNLLPITERCPIRFETGPSSFSEFVRGTFG